MKSVDKQYYDALTTCVFRYMQMLDRIDYTPEDADLDEFLLELLDAIADEKPLMKLNRWLGYIQGCLIERGYTTVQCERDFTRPLFRPLDFPDA